MGHLPAKTVKLKNRSEVLLREVEPADAAPVLDYARKVLDTTEPYFLTCLDELPTTAEEEWQWLLGFKIPPLNLFLVAEHQNQIIGTLSFAANKLKRVSHDGELGISIREDFRDQGLGRQMLLTLIHWARSQKTLHRLSLKVIAANHRAIHLYESLGFNHEGVIRDSVRMPNGFFYDELLMGKLLQ